MRRNTLYVGALLALASMIVVIVGSALDLDLESVALLGAAMGAVIALIPDRTPFARLGGFAAGFVLAWAGYIIRAQFLPDTSNGRAVAVGVSVALCVGVVAVSMDRLPLWSVLLGAGAFAGAYEFTYDAAPPEILSTSLSTATTMAFNVAFGFLAAAIAAPLAGSAAASQHRRHTPAGGDAADQSSVPDEDRAPLDALMKESAK